MVPAASASERERGKPRDLQLFLESSLAFPALCHLHLNFHSSQWFPSALSSSFFFTLKQTHCNTQIFLLMSPPPLKVMN